MDEWVYMFIVDPALIDIFSLYILHSVLQSFSFLQQQKDNVFELQPVVPTFYSLNFLLTWLNLNPGPQLCAYLASTTTLPAWILHRAGSPQRESALLTRCNNRMAHHYFMNPHWTWTWSKEVGRKNKKKKWEQLTQAAFWLMHKHLPEKKKRRQRNDTILESTRV